MCLCVDGSSVLYCVAMQDLQDRMKKEAKREVEDRGALQKDEAAAAREDEEFKVHARSLLPYPCLTSHLTH